MNVSNRYRRYRRRQPPRQAASQVKRIYLFETLESRATPGSMLFFPPSLIPEVPQDSEDRGALVAQPTPGIRHGDAASRIPEVSDDKHLALGDTGLGTAQLQVSVMGDLLPPSTALVPSHDSPSDEGTLLDETFDTDAEHSHAMGARAGSDAARLSSSGGSSNAPILENLPDAAARSGLSRPLDAPSRMPTAEGEGPGLAPTVASAATDDANTGGLSDASEQGVSPAASAESLQIFQNPADPLDVNADGHVGAADVLHVMNGLNRITKPADGVPGISLFLDVNGDGILSPRDVLEVITYLNAGAAAPVY